MILARLLLLVAMALFGCAYALLAFVQPWALVLLGLAVVAALTRRPAAYSTEYGSGRWATADELLEAGVLGARSGMIVGAVPYQPEKIPAIRGLSSPGVGSRRACEDFFAAFSRGNTAVARLPDAVHVAVFAPTGAGKGVSCVVPTC